MGAFVTTFIILRRISRLAPRVIARLVLRLAMSLRFTALLRLAMSLRCAAPLRLAVLPLGIVPARNSFARIAPRRVLAFDPIGLPDDVATFIDLAIRAPARTLMIVAAIPN